MTTSSSSNHDNESNKDKGSSTTTNDNNPHNNGNDHNDDGHNDNGHHDHDCNNDKPVIAPIVTNNTVYGFNATDIAKGTSWDFSLKVPTTKLVLTDTLGIDTIDVSGFTSGCVINMSQDSTSTLPKGIKFMISKGTVIENAIGSGSCDQIRGNSGNNIIDGGAKGDAMTGGGGADTFVFNKLSGCGDIITDFLPSTGDKLDFSSITKGDSSLAFRKTFDHSLNDVITYNNGTSTVVAVDLNGDCVADLTVLIGLQTNLTTDCFIF